MLDDANQQATNPKKTFQEVENEEKNVVSKPIKESFCPETPYTNKNPEKLSNMLKSISSKKKICKQLCKEDKPRTRLRKKMQIEERTTQEGDRDVVVIEDAASEGTLHTARDQYCEDMEKFIDMQGVAGSIPVVFYTDKQDNFDEGSVSKSLHKEGGHIREEDLEISPELNQCKRSLQTYKEQTKYLQDINEKLMVANKRLREDMEDKEAEYQKLLVISKDILREKRAIQRQLEQVKAQS